MDSKLYTDTSDGGIGRDVSVDENVQGDYGNREIVLGIWCTSILLLLIAIMQSVARHQNSNSWRDGLAITQIDNGSGSMVLWEMAGGGPHNFLKNTNGVEYEAHVEMLDLVISEQMSEEEVEMGMVHSHSSRTHAKDEE